MSEKRRGGIFDSHCRTVSGRLRQYLPAVRLKTTTVLLARATKTRPLTCLHQTIHHLRCIYLFIILRWKPIIVNDIQYLLCNHSVTQNLQTSDKVDKNSTRKPGQNLPV